MNTHHLIILASWLLTSALCAQDETQVTKLLKELQSLEIDTRQAAMFELQTSLDPRIPEACLPVLQMEGDSIRRLAARAIGSRWHQIPKDRVPAFTAALKAQLQSEHEGLVNMARRGIALLNRNYGDAMLSRSKSKRWVIYERFGLPCLIDTDNRTEELLGFPSEAKLSAAWSNQEVAPDAIWHPKQDQVALDMLMGRKFSTLWVWMHGKRLRQFMYAEITQALGYKEEDIAGGAGFYTEIDGWKGDSLNLSLSFAVIKDDDYIDHEAKLSWNAATDKLTVLADKVVQ